MAPERRAQTPPPPGPPGAHEEVPDRARAVAVTLVAVVLAIVILVALPRQSSTPSLFAAASTTTTTTTRHHHATGPSTTSTTTSTLASNAVHVAVLAPDGAPDLSTVTQKLTSANYVLPNQAPIPASWVNNITSPLVEYPSGLQSQAMEVAKTLGVPSSAVSEEASGPATGTVGANDIEVFLPAS